MTDCAEIIAEFDTSEDGTLVYEEFINLFAPATNMALREQVLYGQPTAIDYYIDKTPDIPVSVVSLVVRILERERDLFKRK